jgi:hypothetical protein
MSAVKEEQHKYCETVYLRSGINHKWISKNSIKFSLHVSVIHRHAMLEYDGIDSNEENPNVITEHFYVISPDQQHNHFFVHEVRKQISEYLKKSISCDIASMHGSTGRCPSQYTSRRCFGDISNSYADFVFSRNCFETSHAKGIYRLHYVFIDMQNSF